MDTLRRRSFHLLSLVSVILVLSAAALLVSARDRVHTYKHQHQYNGNDDQFWTPRTECGKYGEKRSINRSEVSKRIVGGEDAPDGLYPSFVGIMTEREDGDTEAHGCSGVLIDDDIVLTAAHCLKDGKVRGYVISPTLNPVWRWKDVPNLPRYVVKKACRSPLYYPGPEQFDYGFIQLSHPVSLSRNVWPACLPDNEWGSKIGTIVGQGFADHPPNHKHTRAKRLFAEAVKCPWDVVHMTSVCSKAFAPDRGEVCEGDSGSPAYISGDNKHTVVAITSRRAGDCTLPQTTEDSKITIHADLGFYKNKYHVRKSIKDCLEKNIGIVYSRSHDEQGDDDDDGDDDDEGEEEEDCDDD